MKFIDEVDIEVASGKGGDGIVSFRREKYVAFGGPNGGDGGHGGDVVLVADKHLNTLVDFRGARHFKAKPGQPGQGRDRFGRDGEHLDVKVPVGTMVFDRDTDECLGDLTEEDARLCVAKGGEGGKGNARFKTSTNRAPRKATVGAPAEKRRLRLELKLLADVGLLGLPNAGKSTFLRSISRATPKVADYPFTTLVPHLGVVQLSDRRSFVVADIPGLIEGAADGQGLGIQFLRHVQRTGLLLHMVDISENDPNEVVTNVKLIEQELASFDAALMRVPRWLVLTKKDTLDEEAIETLKTSVLNALAWKAPVYVISGLAKDGVNELNNDIWHHLNQGDAK